MRPSSSTGAYTALMSESEAQRALGFAEKKHVLTLMVSHFTKHDKHSSLPDALGITGYDEYFVPGAAVKAVAECNECFPAVSAARCLGTEFKFSMPLPEEVDL